MEPCRTPPAVWCMCLWLPASVSQQASPRSTAFSHSSDLTAYILTSSHRPFSGSTRDKCLGQLVIWSPPWDSSLALKWHYSHWQCSSQGIEVKLVYPTSRGQPCTDSEATAEATVKVSFPVSDAGHIFISPPGPRGDICSPCCQAMMLQHVWWAVLLLLCPGRSAQVRGGVWVSPCWL